MGETYLTMLNYSITSWPPTKRMTLVSIETISRAINETLSSRDYTNVTAVVSRAARALAEVVVASNGPSNRFHCNYRVFEVSLEVHATPVKDTARERRS